MIVTCERYPRLLLVRRLSATAAVALGLPLLLALGSCGKARSPVAPAKPSGVEPSALGPAVHALDFARFVTDVVLFDWSRNGRFDASWSYDPSAGVWRKVSDGTQTVHVGGGLGSTEIDDRTTVTLNVQLLKRGAIQPDLLTADRARMDLVVRQHRYALSPDYPLEDGCDVLVSFHAELGLHSGTPDTLEAAGSLTGWADRTSGGLRWRAGYQGPATLRFEYAGGDASCPGQQLTADIRVLSGGVEVDRYRGVIAAAPGESRFAGTLRSENGAGGYGIDLDRGCPAAAAAR